MVLANASETESLEPSGHAETERQHSTKVLMLGALGVVYGDIGTSPIYAFREALHASGGVVARNDVLGVLSLIVWALTIIVTIKYVAFVLRADNKGEGGTLSLMALARSAYPQGSSLI
ncbi:MAG: potassium transporter Kup, partial [Mesorhizobium sp.]